MPATLTLETIDITRLAVDAIVNAANPMLLGGGGVDGAIHAAAGPDLARECEALEEQEPGVRCHTGKCVITRGYRLPAKHVIHTVGPIWHEHAPLSADHLLASCYRSALLLAQSRQLRTIAFPCISTGAYGFPPQRAAQIAISTSRQCAQSFPGLQSITFSVRTGHDRILYEHLLGITPPDPFPLPPSDRISISAPRQATDEPTPPGEEA